MLPTPGVSILTTSAALLTLTLSNVGLHAMDSSGSAAVSAGSMDSDSGLNFEGDFALRLGNGFGVQVDGLHSSIDSIEFTGGGAQVFWQNNTPWLANLGASYVHGETLDTYEISTGLEFQQSWYSIGAKMGYGQIDYENWVPFMDDQDNSLIMELHADFYASETLRASLGVENRYNLYFAKAEVEWLTPVDGLSVFANAMIGENDYDHALVGMRYYFGGHPSSLKGRRETPHPMGTGLLHTIGNHGAYRKRRGNDYIASINHGGPIGGGPLYNGGTVITSGGTSSVSAGGSGSITAGGGTLVVTGGSGLIKTGNGASSLTGGTGLITPDNNTDTGSTNITSGTSDDPGGSILTTNTGSSGTYYSGSSIMLHNPIGSLTYNYSNVYTGTYTLGGSSTLMTLPSSWTTGTAVGTGTGNPNP